MLIPDTRSAKLTLTNAARLLLSAIWHHPLWFLAGGILLGTSSIALGMGTWKLIERRQSSHPMQSARALVRPGILLPIAVLLFSLADGALFWALPRLRLSYASGAELLVPLLASVLFRVVLLWGLAAAKLAARAGMLVRSRLARAGARPGRWVRMPSTTLLFLAINLAFSVVQIDAYVAEPQLVQTTELSLSFDSLAPDAPSVRVVHLTDVHIERYSYREAATVRRVNALQPDIIVLTGDYLNLSRLHDPTSAAHLRRFVSQLKAPYGIYAVRGTVEPSLKSMAWLVQGTDVTWLEQEIETIDVRGQKVSLVGVACSHDLELDTARLDQALNGLPQAAEEAFTLLLYHSPDLILEAADRKIDLYLSGHTHGGQIRLPFLGPIVTGSMYGHRYVAGLFQEGGTQLYNSRGLGLEGSAMPRARFLCPPEIVTIELQGR
jgi:predicted MPP superfamily phosphohydrolase